MTNGVKTIVIFSFIVLAAAIAPRAVIPAAQVATLEAQNVTHATQSAPDGNTIKPTATPIVTLSLPPATKVAFYPFSVNGDTNLTVKWEVSGGAPGEISHTAVHWGYKSKSANISDYPRVSNMQTGKTPQEFSVEIMAPAGGTFYFRVHAVVDGVNIYSPEYQIIIIAPMGGGGGKKAVSGDASKIEIDDVDNKIKYQDFDKGNPWNITLWNVTTNALEYQFNDAIGEPDTVGNNWYIWLGHISPNEQHGIQKCVFPGNYNVYANASHNGIIIEKNGYLTVNSSEACLPPIPASELNPIILVFAGLLGILLVSRKHRGNFS